MNASPDIESILDAWLGEGRDVLPERSIHAVLATVGRTPQRSALRAPWRTSNVTTIFRLASVMGVAIAAVLATGALIFSLGGNRLSIGGPAASSTPSAPAPTAAARSAGPPPTLGTDIPAGGDSGVIDTPLGRARWVHLTGDPSTLPNGAPVARGSMFVSSADGGPAAISEWTSPDGLRWTLVPVERSAGSNPDYRSEGDQLWRSTDRVTWELIDLSGVVPARPFAAEWDPEIWGVSGTDAVTAVELTFTARDPFPGWPGDPSSVTEVEPGLFSILGRDRQAPPRLLRFEETPTGLRVVEEADGTEVAMLEGFTLDLVREWFRTGPPVEHLVGRIVGDKLVATSAPGPVLGEPMLAMMPVANDIVALALSDPSGPAIAWRLDDRGTWTELGPWDITEGGSGGTFFVGGTDTGESSFWGQADTFRAEYHEPGTSSTIKTAWSSGDGVHWQQVLESPPPESVLLALRGRYLALQWTAGGKAWWASPDGSTWSPLDLSGIGLTQDRWHSTEPGGGDVDFGLGAVGDAAFIVIDDGAGNRDMWALSFDAPPA